MCLAINVHGQVRLVDQINFVKGEITAEVVQ